MRVLRIVGSMNPAHGGVVEAVNQACLSFKSTEKDMDVLCFDSRNEPWVGSSNGYNIFTVGKGRTAYSISLSYIYWLWKNARQYDVVIFDGLWLFLSFGSYILKLLDVPYCVFTHGMLDPYFNKDRLKYYKKLPFWFIVERNSLAMANSVIFTCAEERDIAKLSFPFYKSRPSLVTLGVDNTDKQSSYLLSVFFQEFPQLQHKKILFFISRINKKKGLDLLIEALSEIKLIPDNFMLAIAGPDNDGLTSILKLQIDKLGLNNKIVWLGMLHGDIKWGAYHAADAFVLPSHQENFGIVVAESLSTATPVLITNKVNIWREIDDAGAGFVENDDVSGIENLLIRWLELDDSEKRLMSDRALGCYQNNFSIESAASDLEAVLIDVVSKRDI